MARPVVCVNRYVTYFAFGNFSLLVLFLSVVAMVHCYCCYRFFRLLWLCMYYICMMICFFFLNDGLIMMMILILLNINSIMMMIIIIIM